MYSLIIALEKKNMKYCSDSIKICLKYFIRNDILESLHISFHLILITKEESKGYT